MRTMLGYGLASPRRGFDAEPPDDDDLLADLRVVVGLSGGSPKASSDAGAREEAEAAAAQLGRAIDALAEAEAAARQRFEAAVSSATERLEAELVEVLPRGRVASAELAGRATCTDAELRARATRQAEVQERQAEVFKAKTQMLCAREERARKSVDAQEAAGAEGVLVQEEDQRRVAAAAETKRLAATAESAAFTAVAAAAFAAAAASKQPSPAPARVSSLDDILGISPTPPAAAPAASPVLPPFGGSVGSSRSTPLSEGLERTAWPRPATGGPAAAFDAVAGVGADSCKYKHLCDFLAASSEVKAQFGGDKYALFRSCFSSDSPEVSRAEFTQLWETAQGAPSPRADPVSSTLSTATDPCDAPGSDGLLEGTAQTISSGFRNLMGSGGRLGRFTRPAFLGGGQKKEEEPPQKPATPTPAAAASAPMRRAPVRRGRASPQIQVQRVATAAQQGIESPAAVSPVSDRGQSLGVHSAPGRLDTSSARLDTSARGGLESPRPYRRASDASDVPSVRSRSSSVASRVLEGPTAEDGTPLEGDALRQFVLEYYMESNPGRPQKAAEVMLSGYTTDDKLRMLYVTLKKRRK